MKTMQATLLVSVLALAKTYAETSPTIPITSRDGINLNTRWTQDAAGNEELECIATNTNTFPIMAEMTNNSGGFEFRLLDIARNEISPDPSWQGRIADISDNWVGRRMPYNVDPGGIIKYKFPIRKVFKDKLQKGVSVIVEWIPGHDGRGNTITRGMGLKTEIPLPGRSQADVASPTTISTARGASENSIPPKTLPADDTAVWFLIGGIAASTTGIAWLLIRRRAG